jgi:hypothetical protein
MTKPVTNFRVPTIRRAIRLAHAEQLVVGSVDIKADGTVHLEFRPYELAELELQISKKSVEHGTIDGELRSLMKRASSLVATD